MLNILLQEKHLKEFKKGAITENVITALKEFDRKYGVNLTEMSLFVHCQLMTRLRSRVL